MRDKEVAKQTELNAHLDQPWNYAHNIWPNIKANVFSWTSQQSACSLTSDSTWRDLQIAAGAKIAVLGFSFVGSGSDYFYVHWRKKGSGSACESHMGGVYHAGGIAIVECDANGYVQYNSTIFAGTLTVWKIGYLKWT